jgi:hypothetical protein
LTAELRPGSASVGHGPVNRIPAPETNSLTATPRTAVAAQGMAMLEGFATTADGKCTSGVARPEASVPGFHVVTTTANVRRIAVTAEECGLCCWLPIAQMFAAPG